METMTFESKLNHLVIFLAICLTFTFIATLCIVYLIEANKGHAALITTEQFFNEGNYIEDYRLKIGDTVHKIGLMVHPNALIATLAIIATLIGMIAYTGIKKI